MNATERSAKIKQANHLLAEANALSDQILEMQQRIKLLLAEKEEILVEVYASRMEEAGIAAPQN